MNLFSLFAADLTGPLDRLMNGRDDERNSTRIGPHLPLRRVRSAARSLRSGLRSPVAERAIERFAPGVCLLLFAAVVLGSIFLLSHSGSSSARVGPVGATPDATKARNPTELDPYGADPLVTDRRGSDAMPSSDVGRQKEKPKAISPQPLPTNTLSMRHPHLTGLLLPVRGVAAENLQNTYQDARSGGRTHNAIDIMAPRGTPVLAAKDGVVAKLFESRLGGKTIYIYDDDGDHVHYYAHLDSYRPGIAEGDRIRRGQQIARVGSTGNAPDHAPHLHYAIYALSEGESWWQGTPLNPYPLLADSAP